MGRHRDPHRRGRSHRPPHRPTFRRSTGSFTHHACADRRTVPADPSPPRRSTGRCVERGDLDVRPVRHERRARRGDLLGARVDGPGRLRGAGGDRGPDRADLEPAGRVDAHHHSHVGGHRSAGPAARNTDPRLPLRRLVRRELHRDERGAHRVGRAFGRRTRSRGHRGVVHRPGRGPGRRIGRVRSLLGSTSTATAFVVAGIVGLLAVVPAVSLPRSRTLTPVGR